ncbi:MAG TPA: enolase C-terminal domain-like protein [Solirubrobacterales bacterium]
MIRRVEVIPYALPLREPYVTSRGRLERRELILLRLTDADGLVGLGETTSMSLRGGRALEAIAAELRRLARLVADEPAGVSAHRLSRELGSPEAACALSIAVMDIELRREPAPAPAPVSVNATLSSGSPGEVASTAAAWAARGFSTFKLKLGTVDDVAQAEAVREAVGAEARIRVDANGAWSAGEATRILAQLEPVGIELCEQPVASLGEMAVVRAATEIPIAADESVTDPAGARRAAELGACDLATLKLAKVGGPVAAERGEWAMPVYVSSALEGPVGIAAAGRVAAAMDSAGAGAGIAHGLATQLLFAETVAARGPEIRDGTLVIPDGPGLGVELDDEALARHRL